MYTVGNKKHSTRTAFTLIELLVVIGIITILVGGIGVAMRDNNPTAALRAGQNVVIGLISSARGQAALNQADAMIIVDVTTPGNNDYLRSVQVVVSTGTNTWKPVGSPVLLPKGIYIVPPSGFSTGVSMTGTWTNRQSSGFLSTTAAAVTESPLLTSAFVGKTYLQFTTFTALGAISATKAATLLVAPGKQNSATTITFDNPEMVRGLLLSRYGVPTLINEGATFSTINYN